MVKDRRIDSADDYQTKEGVLYDKLQIYALKKLTEARALDKYRVLESLAKDGTQFDIDYTLAENERNMKLLTGQ